MSAHADRLRRTRAAMAESGLDALLIPPSADLRYLLAVPPDQHAGLSERLTCLVLRTSGDPVLVVPRLERPGHTGHGLDRLGVEIADWVDGEDAHALVASLLPANPSEVALSDVM